MAAVTRRQYKGAAASTTITAGINSSATSCSLAANTGWPSSSGVPFYVVIDPGTSTEEKCSATIAGTTLTLTRGQDDTTAVAHSANAVIYPVFSADEADEANLFASTMTTRGDLLTMGSGPTVARLAVSSNSGYVLTSDGTDPVWGQVAAAGIATGAVTSAKILDATIVQGDLALTLLKVLCPVGTISAYAGATAPTGWILCDGTAVVSGTHPELYALCATTPDLKGRFALGKTAAGTGSTLLGTGGSTTITTGNLPSHSHANTATAATTITDPSHSHTITVSGAGTHAHDYQFTDNSVFNVQNAADSSGLLVASYTTTAVGGDGSHTHTGSSTAASTGITAGTTVTMTNASTGSGDAYNQPFVSVNYIIKHDYV